MEKLLEGAQHGEHLKLGLLIAVFVGDLRCSPSYWHRNKTTGGATARRLHIKACPVTSIPPPRRERGRSDGNEKGNIVSGLLTRQQMSEHQRHKQEGPAEAVLAFQQPPPPHLGPPPLEIT